MNIKNQIINIVRSKNFKHGMLYTIFSFVNSGISFILLLILARFLKPYDYGQLNLFTTSVTILNIVISLCTNSYISVAFFQKSKEALRQIILIAFVTTTLMLVLFSIILLLFPGFIEKSIGIPLEYVWLVLFICYFGVFNSVNLEIWRLEEKPVSYGLYSVSFAVCNFILTFLFIVGLKYGWIGRVYAWSILSVIYFLISLIFLIKRKYIVICTPQKLLIKETFIYALPIIPHLASFWLKSGLDRYIINYYHEQTVVGYFSFAANLAAIITVVGNAFNSTNSVFIYKNLADGYEKVRAKLSKQTKIMTGTFAFIAIGVMLFAWGLISLFLPQYSDSLPYIIPLCLGGFFQCVYLLWVNYLFFYKKTQTLMQITLSTAFLQLILSLWLTRYSAIYTAWISMGIVCLTMLLVHHFSYKELNRANINYIN